MNSLMGHFDSLGAILGLILGFSFLIFVHELGHHLVAKWVGIKVTQFAIGFGPSVVSWRKGIGFRPGSTEAEYEKRIQEAPEQTEALGETEYRLNWVPLGGYVKMHGQEDLNPEASACDDERSFNAKPVWARACVISAGVVMNLIFGAIFFVIAFMAGVEFPSAIAGLITPGSPAALANAVGHENDESFRGLQTGDRITHIDGTTVTDFTDIAVNVALAGPNQTLKLTVERPNEPTELMYPIKPKTDAISEMLSLGVGRPISLTIVNFARHDARPEVLAKAQVTSGMQVISVAGEPVERYEQFERAISTGEGVPMKVTFAEPDSQQTKEVKLAAIPMPARSPDGNHSHILGLVPAIKIAGVLPSSPAAKAGLTAGDTLVRIGPIAWPTWDQVVEMINQSEGRPIQVTIQRDGQQIELDPITPAYSGKIGIYHGLALDDTVVIHILPDCPLTKLDLNPGSRILSINGQPTHNFGDIQRLLSQATSATESITDQGALAEAAEVAIVYQANIANTSPNETQIEIPQAWATQIANAQWRQPLGSSIFNGMMTRVVAGNPVAAARLGLKKTHQVMLQTYVTLLRLFQGTVPVSQMRGPLGIADAGTSFAKQGWAYLMFFLGLISINLVVINFLPIPIVDGGLLVFLMIEKIKGSPVSIRIQTAATVVGLAMIGSVLMFTLFYDAKRLFGI